MSAFSFYLHNGLANQPELERATCESLAGARAYALRLLAVRPRYREVVILRGDSPICTLHRDGAQRDPRF